MKKVVYLAEGIKGKDLNKVRTEMKTKIKEEKASISSVLGYIEWAGVEWYRLIAHKVDKKLLMNPKLLCEMLTEKEQERVNKRGFAEHLVTELQKRLAAKLVSEKPIAAVVVKKDVKCEDVACEVIA